MASAIYKKSWHLLTCIPQDISTLLSISLSSGKEWERVQARSERNVKEEALGWIPKSYPPHFSVDGGKILEKTISTEQMHLSWRAKGHVTLLHWTTWEYFGGQGNGEGWRRCWDGGGYWDARPQHQQSLSVVLLGILELWMCKGLQYCRGQWNMLKRTLSFRVAGVWPWGPMATPRLRTDTWPQSCLKKNINKQTNQQTNKQTNKQKNQKEWLHSERATLVTISAKMSYSNLVHTLHLFQEAIHLINKLKKTIIKEIHFITRFTEVVVCSRVEQEGRDKLYQRRRSHLPMVCVYIAGALPAGTPEQQVQLSYGKPACSAEGIFFWVIKLSNSINTLTGTYLVMSIALVF